MKVRRVMGLAVLWTVVTGAASWAGVVRVAATSPAPLPDGAMWATAYRSIQAALDATQPGDEVWVAKGIYPDRVTLRADVRLYGGFAGTETQRSQRDPAVNESVLDGQHTTPNMVIAEPGLTTTSVLDGFTIRNAALSGIYLRDTSPLISGNHIHDNGDDGIDCDRSAPEILNNVITGNKDDGIDADFAAPQIRGNLITGNHDDGLQLNTASALVMDNTIASNNDDGINSEADKPRILANRIFGNGDDGIDCNATEAEILNNVIYQNVDVGVSCTGSTPLVASNMIYDNQNNGIRCVSSPARIINNTLSGNVVAALHIVTSSIEMANNIVAFNGFGVRIVETSTGTFTSNCVFEDGNRGYSGTADPTGSNGNISEDPMFVSVAARNLHLQTGSPCINTGNDTFLAPDWQDIDGDPRKVGPAVDIGADEFTTPIGFTLADVATALRISGGLADVNPETFARLNVVADGASATVIDIRDAVQVAREVSR